MKAKNKYIESFLGVKKFVEKKLKNKVWDVKLSIHANEPARKLVHKGRLNAPTVNEVAIVMPTEDELTSKHERYVTFNYKATGEKSDVECIPDYH